MEKKDKKELSESVQEKIAIRNNSFKIIAGTLFLILVGVKFGISDLNFDFSKFDFSDLLALVPAIFSIALSVAFYFQASNTSNKFYDNTYKFTKEISEILGRIEAGFGERLRHLDEGYSGLVDKFDSGAYQNQTEEIESAKKEFDEEKKKIEKEVKEKDELLLNLMKKAKLNENEKHEFVEKLKEKEEEISGLSNELRFLKRDINRAERTLSNEILHSIPRSVREMAHDYIKMSDINIGMLADAPISYIRRRIKFNRDVPSIIHERFLKYEVINEDDTFTDRGIEILRTIARTM